MAAAAAWTGAVELRHQGRKSTVAWARFFVVSWVSLAFFVAFLPALTLPLSENLQGRSFFLLLLSNVNLFAPQLVRVRMVPRPPPFLSSTTSSCSCFSGLSLSIASFGDLKKSVCCFVLFILTSKVYRVPRGSPRDNAPKLFAPTSVAGYTGPSFFSTDHSRSPDTAI